MKKCVLEEDTEKKDIDYQNYQIKVYSDRR